MFASRLSENDTLQTQRHIWKNTQCHAGAAPKTRSDRLKPLERYDNLNGPHSPKTQILYCFYTIHFTTNGSLTRDMRSAICRAALGLIWLSKIATRLLVLQMNTTSTKWVKLDKFCEETGFTRKSVYALIRNGRWMVAKHFTIRNRRYFINIVEYERWVERG
ncbi:hypothetical protein CWI80_08065 [Pseudidiomarina sediminum]|uniref:Uncharacterized protein n=2 Tax=Pseudidiomarina sediminum TaxID=431675 RepID=A0A432Z3M9_9GAMM|nr:hypothetical protein CWI80_08065 [Pseudidiomarina sediminum]